MCIMLSFCLVSFLFNKKRSDCFYRLYSFYFNLSGETMASKPMWSCSLRLSTYVKGCLWRGFGSVYHKWQEMHSWHKRQRIQSCRRVTYKPRSSLASQTASSLPFLLTSWCHDEVQEAQCTLISIYNLCIAGYEMSKHSISTFTKVENGIYRMAEINISYSLKVIIEY